jgi:hypothetical protein
MVNTITEEKGRGAEDGDCEGDSLEVRTQFSTRFTNEQLNADFKGDRKECGPSLWWGEAWTHSESKFSPIKRAGQVAV